MIPALKQYLMIPMALVVVFSACLSTAHGASAVLGGIDITGSEKGLALTLSADGPFSVSLEQKPAAGKNGLAAVVSIRCTKAIYGLDEFSFMDFPGACPVRRIAVSESPAEAAIEITIGMTAAPDKQLLSKQKGNTWIILLSRQSFPGFAWTSLPSASAGAKSATPAKVSIPDNGQARLTDVTMLARDRVERFTFLFDRTTVMRLKREADRVVVLFVNATSDLASQRLTPPSTQVADIELKQVAHGGTIWLGASLDFHSGAGTEAILQAFSDRLVIYCATDSLERLAMWSAKQGSGTVYPFVKMPRLPVDYKGMEEKARTDLAKTVEEGASTFAVREENPTAAAAGPPSALAHETPEQVTPEPASQRVNPPPSPPQAMATKKEPPAAVRLLVAKNNVNLRSGPSASDSLVARLAIGAGASPLARKNGWIQIRTIEATGWVMQAMVVDSSRAPRELLAKIEQGRRQQLEKVAAEERAAQVASQKEKLALEQKAAKQKQHEEALAKKQVEKEALANRASELKAQQQAQKELAAKAAAARDSVIRLKAAQLQDSIERAKRNAPKLVEYHVYGRDPFLPLSRDHDSPVPAVEDLNLVGILYDQADRIGLCEDKNDKARAYALRENDPVQSGYVLRVQPDKMLFLINEMGISRTYALKLVKEKQ